MLSPQAVGTLRKISGRANAADKDQAAMFRPFAASAAALAAVLGLAFAASADSHRDTIAQACVSDGGAPTRCACVADAFADTLSAKELAFYARMIGRGNNPAAANAVRVELDLSIAELGAAMNKINSVNAEVAVQCAG